MEYKTEYIRFPSKEFVYSEKELDVSIGKNRFTKNNIEIHLGDSTYPVEGYLEFSDIIDFPKKFMSPGIMGPFSFVPFMECYHGVVNIHHRIEGKLTINNREVDFTDGYGYIEKDWGKSFPKWWVWMQCNHFKEKDVSLMFSVAKIPWLNHYFTGFLSFLKIDDKIYLFATYSGAKIKKLEYKDGVIDILIEDKKYSLWISGHYKKNGVLKAPKNGMMEREISESISSNVKVVLKNKTGKLIYEGFGKNAGLEVVGKHL